MPGKKASSVMCASSSAARASVAVAQRPSSQGISSNCAKFAFPAAQGPYTALRTKFSPAMHSPFSLTAS